MDTQTQENYRLNYEKVIHQYKKLGENLELAMQDLLSHRNIDYLQISSRIKTFESLCNKIERKNYEDPFEEIEDFCGIRIIAYYSSDLKRIADVIKGEFEVVEIIDKSTLLEPDRFGYRSDHYIVKINKSWADAPNYRGLKDLKAEIQVRTLSMHAWAGIQHKLAYKKEEDAPVQFRRKLSQLSALFEIADERFESLREEREELQKELIKKSKQKGGFDLEQPMNLDTLQGFLDFILPGRSKNLESTANLLGDLMALGISFTEIYDGYKKLESVNGFAQRDKDTKLSQPGVIRFTLDVVNDKYRKQRWDKHDFENMSWGQDVLDMSRKIQSK